MPNEYDTRDKFKFVTNECHQLFLASDGRTIIILRTTTVSILLIINPHKHSKEYEIQCCIIKKLLQYILQNKLTGVQEHWVWDVCWILGKNHASYFT